MGPWKPHTLKLFSPFLHPFFMSTRIEFLASYSMLSQSLVTQLRWPETLSYVCALWGAHANYSYFDTCSRLHGSTASDCNWASYRTCAFYYTIDLIVDRLLIAHLSLYTRLKPTCDKIGIMGHVYIFNKWAFNCRVRGPQFKPQWPLNFSFFFHF